MNDLNKLSRNLKKTSKNLNDLNGTHQVEFSELFTKEFMLSHTNNKFDDFSKLLKDGNFDETDFENIDESKLDSWIKKQTVFDDWKSMMTSAMNKWTENKINQAWKL